MECLNCKSETKNTKFCGRSCANSYNNRLRNCSDETKKKIKNALTISIDEDELKELISQNLSTSEIGKKLNVSKTTILNRLKELNLQTTVQQSQSSEHCKCGEEFRIVKSGRYCVKCRYKEVKLRRVKAKQELVEYKGGCCERCGYNKCLSALEFHHTDPSQKDFSIANSFKNIDKLKTEVDKCLLLCANCHREEHDRLRNE